MHPASPRPATRMLLLAVCLMLLVGCTVEMAPSPPPVPEPPAAPEPPPVPTSPTVPEPPPVPTVPLEPAIPAEPVPRIPIGAGLVVNLLTYVSRMTIGLIILIAAGFYALKKFRARSNGQTMREQLADLGVAWQKVGTKRHRFSGLTRSRKDRVLLGVCGGLGQSLGVDPVLIRIGFVLLGFATAFVGMGFFYLLLVILIPAEGGVEVSASTESASVPSATGLEAG